MCAERREVDGRRMIPKLSCALLVLAATVLPTAHAAEPASARVPALETAIVRQLNTVRAARGLEPLRVNASLSAAAAEHSREMAADGYFAHESADGSSFWRRVERFYGRSTSRRWSVGENLLWSTPRLDAARAVRLWMGSPGHRENMLSAAWRDVGVAAVDAPVAPGTFGGNDVTVVTLDFGVR
jgi:uncharacterized protein YkwD